MLDHQKQYQEFTDYCRAALQSGDGLNVLFVVMDRYQSLAADLGADLLAEITERHLQVLSARTRQSDRWYAPLPGVFALPLIGVSTAASIQISERLRTRMGLEQSPEDAPLLFGLARLRSRSFEDGWVEAVLNETPVMRAGDAVVVAG